MKLNKSLSDEDVSFESSAVDFELLFVPGLVLPLVDLSSLCRLIQKQMTFSRGSVACIGPYPGP